ILCRGLHDLCGGAQKMRQVLPLKRPAPDRANPSPAPLALLRFAAAFAFARTCIPGAIAGLAGTIGALAGVVLGVVRHGDLLGSWLLTNPCVICVPWYGVKHVRHDHREIGPGRRCGRGNRALLPAAGPDAGTPAWRKIRLPPVRPDPCPEATLHSPRPGGGLHPGRDQGAFVTGSDPGPGADPGAGRRAPGSPGASSPGA